MVAVSNMVDLTVEDGVAILTVDNPPVNALSSGVRAGLSDGVAQAAADDNVTAIVLICAGRTFIAGADINEIKDIRSKDEAYEKACFGQQILHQISQLPFPTLAVINGACVGGGCELALACNYRIISDDKKAVIAFKGFGVKNLLLRFAKLKIK